MRVLLGLVLAVGLGLAPGAPAFARPPECHRLERQIAHFEDVARMAHERGDRLWERATRDHIARLEARRARLCPSAQAHDGTIQALGSALRSAGRTAARLFTLGLL